MSFKNKLFSAFTLLFAIVAFTTFVAAQDKPDGPPPAGEGRMDKRFGERKMGGKRFGEGRRGGGPHGDRMFMRALRDIELTEAQQTQIKALMDSHRASFAPQMDEIRSLIQKKRDGSITEAETARLTDIHNQRKASSEQLRNTILGLLTPDQLTKLEQLKAERKLRMEERKQRMMERRQQRENPTDKPKMDN